MTIGDQKYTDREQIISLGSHYDLIRERDALQGELMLCRSSQALAAENDAGREEIMREMARLLEKALTRSAIVHPGFADEIRAILAKAGGA